MIVQILIGLIVIVLSIAIEVAFIGYAETVITHAGKWFLRPPYKPKRAFSLMGATLWLMVAHSVVVWLWAIVFLATGTFETLEPALYFSIVTFTTLGYGDILLNEEWRLLSGMAAANGLLIFGVSTAFLVEFMSQVHRAQDRENT